MALKATIHAEIMFQAAVAVGHHACSKPSRAIREGAERVMGKEHPELQARFQECVNLYGLLLGVHPWQLNAKDFHCTGPSWQMWLSNQGRSEMVMTFLFMYEYIVQEMLGDRVTIPEHVTPRNDDQTVVHPQAAVV